MYILESENDFYVDNISMIRAEISISITSLYSLTSFLL